MQLHLYVGWVVTLKNGNVVNFTDQGEAVRYWGDHPDATTLEITRRTIPCGLESRSFCGHCQDGVPLVSGKE